MGKSAESASQGDADESEQQRAQAQKKMEEARAALRDPKLDDEEKRRLKSIRDEQKKLAEDTKAMEERMKNKDSTKSGADSVQRAQQEMDQAQANLDEGKSDPAVDDEKEAEKYLKMADEKLAEQQQRYNSLQAEEALYKIERELDRIEQAQQSILTRTSELWLARGAEDSFTHKQRADGRKLAEEQDALSTSIDPVVKAVEDEKSAVFGPILHEVKDDMSAAAGKIRKLEPDDLCQGIERDVLARIGELKQAFKDERERRRKAPPPQSGAAPPPSGKPRIVDAVAELQELKLMQDTITRDIESIEKENLPDDPKQLTPAQRSRLERLAHKQGTIRTMWRDFARSMGFSEEEFDKAPEAGTPPKEDAK
jgi:hypothetical protein